MEWIGEFARTVARRPGTSVLVIDGNGTVIGGSPDAGEFVGKNFANHALTRETLRNDEGATTVAGFDGVRRIFGHVRVPGTRARLAVGLDESVVHSGIDREISIAYLQLALFGLLVLLIAWFGGERLIVRPIRSLVRTAARFGRGDLHVRAGDEPWLAEFQPLAAALDDMAHKLAGREEELRVANHHLEELASLDGLSGLANRRGFDRALERRMAAAPQAPRAARAIDDRHRSFQAVQRPLRPCRGRRLPARASARPCRWCASTKPCWSRAMAARNSRCCCQASISSRATALADEARGAIEDLLHRPRRRRRAGTSPSASASNRSCRRQPSGRRSGRGRGSRLYAAKRRGRNTVIARRSDGDERGMMIKAPTHPTPRLR